MPSLRVTDETKSPAHLPQGPRGPGYSNACLGCAPDGIALLSRLVDTPFGNRAPKVAGISCHGQSEGGVNVESGVARADNDRVVRKRGCAKE